MIENNDEDEDIFGFQFEESEIEAGDQAINVPENTKNSQKSSKISTAKKSQKSSKTKKSQK